LLDELRGFNGPPEKFWPACLETLGTIIGAGHALLVIKHPSRGTGWQLGSTWPAATPQSPPPQEFIHHIAEIADTCAEEGCVQFPLPKSPDSWILALRFQTDGQASQCQAAFLLHKMSPEQAAAALAQLQLLADLPTLYLYRQMAQKGQTQVQQFSSVLDLMVLLNRETRFLAAAMTVCNELAAFHGCSRVSLGWLHGNTIRLQAMSQVEKFERKMEAVDLLEQVMEEALEQDEEIIVPAPPNSTCVNRAHRQFAQQQGAACICSVPLRFEDEAVAVITCERETEFSNDDVDRLRLCADQISRLLGDLKRDDRWFGARWVQASLRGLKKLIGVEHTLAKLTALLVTALICALIFIQVDYRVEAPFVLQSHDITYVPAPFDGYIAAVKVEIGDTVTRGQPLLSMDTKDLILERSASQSEHNRYLRELEKARAENSLADMRIAKARAQQAAIKTEILDHRLSQAVIKSPFNGVVVRGELSGELKERLGAPLRRGDVLMKIAALDNLYIQCRIDERDRHAIPDLTTGELAFASQPEFKYPTAVTSIDPSAQASAEGNHFLGQCALVQPKESWFRPGMTGICKLQAGQRRLIWIFTHKTIDFLRMLLWW
jgi:biotin carboxyl carrier protein